MLGAIEQMRSRGRRPDHLALALTALVLPSALFAALAALVLAGATIAWDGPVARAIEELAEGFSSPVPAETLLAVCALTGAAAGIAALCALCARRRMRELAFLVLAVGGMLALDPALKELFQRPPVSDGSSGYSFPSGTAMVSLAAIGAIVVLVGSGRLRRAAIAIAAPVAIALGLSVVYLRWHYPSDVLAGWCLAIAWLSGLWLALLAPRRPAGSRRARLK